MLQFIRRFRCLTFIILYEDKDCGNRYCDWWVFIVQNEMIKLCNGHIFVCPSNHSIIISCLTMTRAKKTDLFIIFFTFELLENASKSFGQFWNFQIYLLILGISITCAKKMVIVLLMLQEGINANLVGSKNACKSIWRKKVSIIL